VGQQFPSFPIVLSHTVFNRDDRVFLRQFDQVCNLLFYSTGSTIGTFELFVIVFSVFVKLRRRTVERQSDFSTWFISGLLNSFQYCFNSIFSTCECRCKSTLISYCGRQSSIVQNLFQGMENLCSPAQCFGERRRTSRHNHKLLECNRCIRVRSTIDDIHHRDRQSIGIHSADVTVKWLAALLRCSFCDSQGNAQDSVSTKFTFVLRTIQFKHNLIDGILFEHVYALQCFSNNRIDIFYCLQNALTQVYAFVAVAQFNCLVSACRSTRRNSCTTYKTVLGSNINFNSWVSARVQNLARMNIDN